MTCTIAHTSEDIAVYATAPLPFRGGAGGGVDSRREICTTHARCHRRVLAIVPIFILFTFSRAFAQLSGLVLDENGQPLPYASVYVRNSTNGTAANADGAFKLSVARGEHDIVFQYIGYKQKIEHVRIADKPVRITVRLEPSDLEIGEVVITTEDPAYGIMRKAIEKREYYKNRTPAYSADVYIKSIYKLTDTPKKIFGQDTGDLDGLLDSMGQGVLYLSESVSKIYVQAKPARRKEVMVSSKVSGSPNGISINREVMTNFTLYNERLEIGRDILSPLADNAFAYYRFRLLGRYKNQSGFDVYKIEVKPKRDEDPTFQGHVYIVDEWWNLAGTDLRLTGKAIQQPLIDTLHFHQEYVLVNQPDVWCLLSQSTSFKAAALGFKFGGIYNGVFSNYDLQSSFGPEVFNRETFKVEKIAVTRDTAYWRGIRPVPLSVEESRDYRKKDSLAQIRNSAAYLDSTDRKNNRFRFNNIWSGYTWRNSFTHTTISYPALTDGFQFNTVQGWLLNFRPEFNKSKDKEGSSYWSGGGALNYGFSEKRLRGNLHLERRFESIHYTQAELSGGLDILQFDESKQIGEVTNLIYSMLGRWNYMKLYEKAFVRGRFSRHIGSGLKLDVGAEYAERRPLVNHSKYSWYKGDHEYAPNAPLPWTDTVPEVPFFAIHQAFILEAALRIRFGETYSTYPNFRHFSSSGLPEITLRYRKAIPGLASSDVDYDLVQAQVRQTDLSLGLAGYTEWNLGGGVFLRNKRVEFMDYYHPRGNQTLIGNPRDYARGFFLLPYYEFSTSDAWAEGHLRHHFNGWILDKIPLLRRLNWNETIGVSAFYAERFAGENGRPNTTLPYWEASIGFENIGIKFLRPLHIDVAVGFYGNEYYRTGVVLGLSL